jgi:hypothetical protein
MAYEGHKKAARDVDEELEQILLEFSLFNMAQNPIRLYGERDIHATPVQEALEQFLSKLSTFKKVSGEVPSLGRFTVEREDDDKPMED